MRWGGWFQGFWRYGFARDVAEEVVEEADVPGEREGLEVDGDVDEEEACAPR